MKWRQHHTKDGKVKAAYNTEYECKQNDWYAIKKFDLTIYLCPICKKYHTGHR